MIEIRPPRTGGKRARTRDQLLVAAQALLMTHSAAALGIRQITSHAGLVHASFYNYYPDVAALIGDLGELLGASHAVMMRRLVSDDDAPALRFARITRQSLRIIAAQPDLGRLMFDVGLPVDRLGIELRLRLNGDIAAGAARGDFTAADPELAASMAAGAINGVALDLHRGALPVTVIDTVTERLLVQLGLDAVTAAALGHEALAVPVAPVLPMRWLALPA